MIKVTLFLRRKLRKIKFRAFPKHVISRILLLQSIDYLGTSEHTLLHYLISKTAMVGC